MSEYNPSSWNYIEKEATLKPYIIMVEPAWAVYRLSDWFLCPPLYSLSERVHLKLYRVVELCKFNKDVDKH